MMVGFLDSGVGGISVLNECSKKIEGLNAVYFYDSANMPYGNKQQICIRKIVFSNCQKLKKMGCKVIVLACNTATAAAINYVRVKMPDIKFVGTEPNIVSPIAENKRNILVLATAATKKFSNILKKHKSRIEVYCPTHLASQIEASKKIDLNKTLAGLKLMPEQYDAVVIGCTHYEFLLPYFERFFINANFYSSKEGVSNRLKVLLEGALKASK